ncbi:hypothetical protein KIL84_002263 [Mauremys mutica]|uniref:Transmembrane protein 106A n=1 Tax=Mauremys mutica TaxID=74926 RepID=A0A9D4AY10_9SAUR|nr:hypothetical protein KIL84_002263 [Mauremys mutica]
MGETFSQFWKVSDQKERGGKSILRRKSAGEDEVTNYGTINGGDSAASCMPCVGTVSRGYINCPTCQGTGRIPREQEKQLVALIPYGDQRLKPRRTKLYVSLAVTICLLMSSLIIFFLFPRSIAVQPAGLNASSIAFNSTVPSINLNMTNVLNVTNNNFYPVTVTQLDIEVLHLSVVIGKTTKKNLLNIGPLCSSQIYYSVSTIILDYNTYNICTWIKIKVHNVLLHIQNSLSKCEFILLNAFALNDCKAMKSDRPTQTYWVTESRSPDLQSTVLATGKTALVLAAAFYTSVIDSLLL